MRKVLTIMALLSVGCMLHKPYGNRLHCRIIAVDTHTLEPVKGTKKHTRWHQGMRDCLVGVEVLKDMGSDSGYGMQLKGPKRLKNLFRQMLREQEKELADPITRVDRNVG